MSTPAWTPLDFLRACFPTQVAEYEAEQARLAALPPGICRKCSGDMKPGQAIQETYTGVPDFPGAHVVTVSAGGPGRLIDCMKCEKCGWSVTR